MACCNGSVTWECVYPDPCSCGCPCCQGNNCSGACNTPYCGLGGCCGYGYNCYSYRWAFAWKQNPPACGFYIYCGNYVYFSVNCSTWFMAYRCDTHQQNASSMADFTKSLFMQFAPLSQGVIYGMRVSNNMGCC